MKKQNGYTRLEHANPEHRNIFIVNWMAGNTCNYSCSYCPRGLHDGSSPWLSYQTAVDFCNRIIAHNADKKTVFEFTGGEISMWPGFIAVARYLHERNVDVSILSNGSRTLRWWQDASPFLKRVHLSYHPEQANRQHFEEVIFLLQDNVSLHINVMMLPEAFDTCYELATAWKQRYPVTVSMQPLLKNLDGPMYAYTNDQRTRMTQHTGTEIVPGGYRSEMVKHYPNGTKEMQSCQHFISSFQNGWYNWLCYAGVEQLIIDRDGDIYRGWCLTGGKTGNVCDAQISFPATPVSCDKYECNCNFDIMCTKKKR
ncbi:MAG: radical SAM protein [Cytophaga sp.]|uniref:radical SAM protein n=1 Tax=Cytophaga sp. TaxID=29535 RepID=UPI003F7E10E5